MAHSDTINKVTLLGRIGANPNSGTTKAGKKWARFNVATDQWGRPGEKAMWHRVVAWGKGADVIANWAKPGERIYVEGCIQYGEWTNREGQKVPSVEIVTSHIVLLGGGSDAQVPYESGPGPKAQGSGLPF